MNVLRGFWVSKKPELSVIIILDFFEYCSSLFILFSSKVILMFLEFTVLSSISILLVSIETVLFRLAILSLILENVCTTSVSSAIVF